MNIHYTEIFYVYTWTSFLEITYITCNVNELKAVTNAKHSLLFILSWSSRIIEFNIHEHINIY